MAKAGRDGVGARWKLPLLLLLYPGAAWLLVNMSGADTSPSNPPRDESLIALLNEAVYLVIVISFLFLAAVPLWSSHYRKRPLMLTAAFRRGLHITSALVAVILPVQGLLLALGLALYDADPSEFWLWGIFTAGGAIMGTVVLLNSGLHNQPGVYLTLRATRIQLDQHSKLAVELQEIAEATTVPLPSHVLLGLQPELFWTTATVFCPDGELEGGVLCLSLPTSSILSIAEFRALTAEALHGLQAGLREGRTQFLSTTEAAKDVLTDLNQTMHQWSWRPRLGFHPALVVFWFAIVAAMRFPLYVGKELLTYYLKEFWTSRKTVDLSHSVAAHFSSTEDVGSIPVITALIKEAAVSLRLFTLNSKGDPLHPLGEIARWVVQEHPELRFENRASSYHDPVSAWQYLEFRCGLSGVSLEWCRQMALEVSPEPSAVSLLEGVAGLEARLVDLAKSPFVHVRR